ncbi:MAG: HepT-like ribonuclease domain-containing protein [Nanoarchaeota archaeon]
MVPMGLDREQLLLQMSRLEESLKRIEKLRKDELDNLTRSALERLVQIAVEEALNIGNHVISGLALPKADTYREIFLVLEQEKIIPKELSLELQRFAVFRNRIVHLYWKISEKEFLEQLGKIKFLREFSRTIVKYAKKERLL